MANARADSRVSAPDHELRTRSDADSGPPFSDGPPRVGSGWFDHSYHSPKGYQENVNPKLQKSLDAITSSLTYLGGKVGSVLEKGLSIAENKGEAIIKETRKLNARRKQSGSHLQSQAPDTYISQHSYSQIPLDQEIQLKAARDVANAMAAKAKLLMRELKTAKMDLAFAKERCAQLQDENKALRESHERGKLPDDDDDLILLQLETLLAEKTRLAQENAIHARENRFLREVVEYHQLRMQDVVYLNESIEEVSEVDPLQLSIPHSYILPRSPLGNVIPVSPTSPLSEPLNGTSLRKDSTSSYPVPVPPPFADTPFSSQPLQNIRES